jgi:predicted membrane protein
VVLIILTILILGPLVFVGSCVPAGLVLGSAFALLHSQIIMIYVPFAIIIGILLAIFVCYLIIKKILKSNSKTNVNNTSN